MSVATSPCEAAAVPLDRGAGSVVPLRRPAVHGEAALSLRHLDGETRPADLYQRDPLSLRLPRPARGDILEACLITTSGGIVGGDRLEIAVTAGQGAQARVYPQAAEKVYRSTGADSRIDVTLTSDEGCWLEWLPQETILFDGARLRRRTTLDLAAGSRVLAGEFLVFGRRASGEQLARGLIHDAWRVRRGGTLVWADALHMDGDLAAPLTSPACLGGATAFASMIYAADDAASHLAALRDLLPPESDAVQHALTAVNGLIVGRFIGEAMAVRGSFGRFWGAARAALADLPPLLPRLWYL